MHWQSPKRVPFVTSQRAKFLILWNSAKLQRGGLNNSFVSQVIVDLLVKPRRKTEKTANSDLFCTELILHQLWDHGVVVGFHSRLHFGVLHVFGLENVLHSWEEAGGHTNKHLERCLVASVVSPDPNRQGCVSQLFLLPNGASNAVVIMGPQWEGCFATSKESSRSD